MFLDYTQSMSSFQAVHRTCGICSVIKFHNFGFSLNSLNKIIYGFEKKSDLKFGNNSASGQVGKLPHAGFTFGCGIDMLRTIKD